MLLANLGYHLVAETGVYTIEQLKWVNIRLLKYLTDRADDPIAIPASKDFPHTPHASTSNLGRAEVLEASVPNGPRARPGPEERTAKSPGPEGTAENMPSSSAKSKDGRL